MPHLLVATAGHVDHGKSSLVRALTGMDTDTLAEEKARGLTIALGYAWTPLPSGATLAIVDVPGHARFLPTMLAGVGAVRVVLLLVAADAGWQQQTVEHVQALHALRVDEGVVIISRSDLADPGPALAETRERLAPTTLRRLPVVAASATTGEGIEDVRSALDRVAARVAARGAGAAVDGPVRLWVDRSFTLPGAGRVVTGSLPAGTIGVGGRLRAIGAGTTVQVRGLQQLGEPADRASGPARVALRLGGGIELERGEVLVEEGLPVTDTCDVLADEDLAPGRATWHAHVGTVDLEVALRSFGSSLLRIRWPRPLPLLPGDRVVLRSPGSDTPLLGARVLDAAPPAGPVRAADRRTELQARLTDRDADAFLLRHRLATVDELAAAGHQPVGVALPEGFRADPGWWRAAGDRLRELVADRREGNGADGPTLATLTGELGLRHTSLARRLAQDAGLRVEADRVLDPADDRLPPAVEQALAGWEERWAREPFWSPDADEVDRSGLRRQDLALARRVGRLEAIPGPLLPAGSVRRAEAALRSLPSPFTLSQARQHLGTTRRVAVPLLEHLDACGVTERVDATRRALTSARRDPASPP